MRLGSPDGFVHSHWWRGEIGPWMGTHNWWLVEKEQLQVPRLPLVARNDGLFGVKEKAGGLAGLSVSKVANLDSALITLRRRFRDR